MFALETPVLCVAMEAVSKVEGEDALCGLLTLFSKCKESLQDGPRLENMCWRLWHRERIASHSPRSLLRSLPDTPHATLSDLLSSSEESESSSDGEGWDHTTAVDESAAKLVSTPSSPPPHLLPSPATPTRFSSRRSNDSSSDLCNQSLPLASSWHPSDAIRPSLATRRAHSHSSVGRIMADLIPDKLVVSTAKNLSASEREKWRESSSTLDFDNIPPVVIMPDTVQPSTPSRFPKVVIVNPTPHPTPPMTPQVAVDPNPTPIDMKQLQLTVPTPRYSSLMSPTSEPSSRPITTSSGDIVAPQPDRKFFIAQGESPDGDSPDTSASSQIGVESAAGGEPSSVASGHSQGKSISSVGSDAQHTKSRKGKEVGHSHHISRPGMYKTQSHGRLYLAQHKASTNLHRAKVPRVGSNSSNGMRSSAAQIAQSTSTGLARVSGDGPSSEDARAPRSHSPLRKGAGTGTSKQRIEIANTSSEFETTDNTDDESWASDESADGGEADRNRESGRLKEAASEVQRQQRQQDLFPKVPRPSYTNLNRTQSGLLSTLFHPDPERFPLNHPYRHSRSSQDILARSSRQQLYSPAPLLTSKTSAVVSAAEPVTTRASASSTSKNARSPLRLKGRPEEELEESDSGEDDTDNNIQMSSSVAVQRLAALDKGRRPQEPSNHNNIIPESRPQLTSVVSSPMPLGYPYNMPTPIPPSTPRTTRRNMLSNELSESLRRNLLWERQVSKQRPMGVVPRRQVGALTSNVRTLSTITAGEPPTGAGPTTTADVEERKQKAMARNKSWADDYHGRGW